MFSISNYLAPGPIAAEFIRDSTSTVPFIMGPVGSGKTNAAIFKLLRHTALLPPTKNGTIVARGTVVRTDYRTLYKTTLATWHQWFPADYAMGNFVGGADRPATHELKFTTPRGRRIDLTVQFQALGDKRIEDVLRGWEGTWAWMNEVDLLAQSALEFLQQRVPRYPRLSDLAHGGELVPLVIGDLNPPGDPDHWIVKDFMDAPKTGYKLYQQPSGMSPDAENVANLPTHYYQRLSETMEPWNVQRFVHGKVGYDRSGLPVYPEFDARYNISATPLKPIAGQNIYIGLDAALHPAAVIGQRAPDLQLRILEELYADRIGPTRFGEMLASVLEQRYRECPVGYVFYDPSADYGADKEGGEQSWIDIVRKAIGVPCIPAPSNEIALRVEGVRNLIVMPITGDKRALVVDPGRCPMLIKGFMSHYRYKLNPDGNLVNPGTPKPDKTNFFSNVHDANQYLCLGLLGRAGTIASAAKGFRPGQATALGRSNGVIRSEFMV